MRLVWAQYALDDRDAIFTTLKMRTRRLRFASTRRLREPFAVSSIFPKAVDLVE